MESSSWYQLDIGVSILDDYGKGEQVTGSFEGIGARTEGLLAKITSKMLQKGSSPESETSSTSSWVNGTVGYEAPRQLQGGPYAFSTQFTKIKFPRIGSDFKGWLCRCSNSFEVDDTPKDQSEIDCNAS